MLAWMTCIMDRARRAFKLTEYHRDKVRCHQMLLVLVGNQTNAQVIPKTS